MPHGVVCSLVALVLAAAMLAGCDPQMNVQSPPYGIVEGAVIYNESCDGTYSTNEWNASPSDVKDRYPDVAGINSQMAVVVWQRFYGIDHQEIRAQPMDALGQPVGSEMGIVTGATVRASAPAVAAGADQQGSRVAFVWVDEGASPDDIAGSLYFWNAIQQQLVYYTDLVLPTSSGQPRLEPDVALLYDTPNLAVVWKEPGNSQLSCAIHLALCNTSGVCQSHMVVGLSPTNTCHEPTVAGFRTTGHEDELVVAWNVDDASTNTHAVHYRRLRTDGTFLDANPVQVNTSTAAPSNARSALAVLGDDTFIVAWTGNPLSGTGTDIWVRHIVPGGGSPFEIVVNTIQAGSQQDTAAAPYASGSKFVVAWRGPTPGSSQLDDIYYRRFAYAAGSVTALDNQDVMANQVTANLQDLATGDMMMCDAFVLAWRSFGQAGTSQIRGRYPPP